MDPTSLFAPENAAAVRFLQDQQIYYTSDPMGREAMPFLCNVASWCEQLARIMPKQREAIERIIEQREWIEPPRWRPFAVVAQIGDRQVYRVYVCPGERDEDAIAALLKERPSGMGSLIGLGGLSEITWDADDPRRDRSSYVTVCRRQVEMARERGTLTSTDAEPPHLPPRVHVRPEMRDWRRPPEPVYGPPVGIKSKITPVPLRLLLAMHSGGELKETVANWIGFRIHGNGRSEHTNEIAILPLRRRGFIERIGELPPGIPERVTVLRWRITDAGRAWLAANETANVDPDTSRPQSRKSATEVGK